MVPSSWSSELTGKLCCLPPRYLSISRSCEPEPLNDLCESQFDTVDSESHAHTAVSSQAKRQEGGALCSNWALGCLAICRVVLWAGESVRGEGVGAVPVGWDVVDEMKWNLNSSPLWDRCSLHPTVLHTHSGQPATYRNLESENLLFNITAVWWVRGTHIEK
jgi:hypothetical protein